MVLGRLPDKLSPAIQYFTLIHKNFRPRTVKLPIFTDDALQRLTMPVLAILGGKDVLLNSAETKQGLECNVAHAQIRYLPEAGHFIPGQTAPILRFLAVAAQIASHAR
jgi:pimeloyl-ACP methyl ester carboxylesterase